MPLLQVSRKPKPCLCPPLTCCLLGPQELVNIGTSNAPGWQKNLRRLPIFERFAKNLLQLFLGQTLDQGSVDFMESQPALSY